MGLQRGARFQGRGTYVLDTTGRVVYVHQARTAADIPRVEDVVTAVRSIAASAVD